MPARPIVAAGWCLDRDRRWPSYHAQAQHDPWPMSLVFTRSDSDRQLLCVARGVGGGSQQATFRNELERTLGEGWARCCRAGWSGDLEAQLRSYEEAVQRSFLDCTQPFFADHFGAAWVAALTDGVHCALVSQDANRAWLLREGRALQVTRDNTLADLPGYVSQGAEQDRFCKGVTVGQFGTLAARVDPRAFVGPLVAFDWKPGDVLAMVTGVSPFVATPERLGELATTPPVPGDLEQSARVLYDALEAATVSAEKKDLPRFQRHAAVLLATSV